jgi:hypothetical protein
MRIKLLRLVQKKMKLTDFLSDDEKEDVHVTEMPEEKRILPY